MKNPTVICGSDDVLSKFAHNKFAHTSREFTHLSDYGGDCSLNPSASSMPDMNRQPIPMIVDLAVPKHSPENAPYKSADKTPEVQPPQRICISQIGRYYPSQPNAQCDYAELRIMSP